LVIHRLIALLALLAIASCASNDVRFTAPPPAVDDNVLGPNDVFAVRVFGEADMSADYRVAPDGTIDFPYIGRVRVQGLTPPQVADRLQTELHDRQILRQPQVSIFVREINSRTISILGQVQHPGTFPFLQNMNIVQAITTAGGFTPLANQHAVRLTRRIRNGGTRTYELPVDAIAEGRAATVLLAPGDVIFVPERAF
jgi:polysaccharide export outer membrane protein